MLQNMNGFIGEKHNIIYKQPKKTIKPTPPKIKKPLQTKNTQNVKNKKSVKIKNVQSKSIVSVPLIYQINQEITGLATQFLKSNLLLPPISLPPITQPPITQPPIIQPPITQPPITQPPITQPQDDNDREIKTLTTNPHSTLTPNIWKTLPIYVVSIHLQRQKDFLKHLTLPNVNIWNGTIGKYINIPQWIKQGKIENAKLRKGEVGCYDSHLRLWEKIYKDQVPFALICEDDAYLTASPEQTSYLTNLLNQSQSIPYDVLFLSWFRPDSPDNIDNNNKNNSNSNNSTNNIITPNLRQQWCFNQTWAYIVTRKGLENILFNPLLTSMHYPVDVALWKQHQNKKLLNVVAYPPLCLTRGEKSDTA